MRRLLETTTRVLLAVALIPGVANAQTVPGEAPRIILQAQTSPGDLAAWTPDDRHPHRNPRTNGDKR